MVNWSDHGASGRGIELNRQNQSSGQSWQTGCEIHLCGVERPEIGSNFPVRVYSENSRDKQEI